MHVCAQGARGRVDRVLDLHIAYRGLRDHHRHAKAIGERLHLARKCIHHRMTCMRVLPLQRPPQEVCPPGTPLA